jgi:DNA-directed RNA polymerase subunit RPC12/RpoP
LIKNGEDKRQEDEGTDKIYHACPHCGRGLSPWQQVLLSIDRALVCRNCWYRIILDISQEEEIPVHHSSRSNDKE